MKKPVLDDFTDQKNRQYLSLKILFVIIIGVLFLNLKDLGTEFYPDNIFDFETIQLKFGVALLLVFLLIMSFVLTNILHKDQPQLRDYQISIISGFAIGITELIHQLISNLFIIKQILSLQYDVILKLIGIFGIFGFLFSNIIIHSLRKKKLLYPILLLFGVWVLIGFVIEITT